MKARDDGLIHLAYIQILFAAAAWANPPTAVSEDFSGTQFPPTEWTTEGSGQGNWSWRKPGGYARVFVIPWHMKTLAPR